jgi:hypothetical protein
MGPKLQVTKDYSLFEMHEFNRPMADDGVLEDSMKNFGFMPSCAIHCVRGLDGKLRIVRGHRRFDKAKRLGLPVWYIVDETNKDIFYLEGVRSQWSANDFACARAVAGDKDCDKLIEFRDKHHLPLATAAALVGGQSATSNNKVKNVKSGAFRIGDMKHANQVVRITDRCRELNIPFATAGAFVSAISLSLRIPEFDDDLFIHRIDLNGSQIRKRGTVTEYLDEIEALYNYGAKKNRLPVAGGRGEPCGFQYLS